MGASAAPERLATRPFRPKDIAEGVLRRYSPPLILPHTTTAFAARARDAHQAINHGLVRRQEGCNGTSNGASRAEGRGAAVASPSLERGQGQGRRGGRRAGHDGPRESGGMVHAAESGTQVHRKIRAVYARLNRTSGSQPFEGDGQTGLQVLRGRVLGPDAAASESTGGAGLPKAPGRSGPGPITCGQWRVGRGQDGNFKIVVKYLTQRGTASGAGDTQLAKRISAVSPVLESFGNAATMRNHNSSRFGRFVKLLFAPSGKKVVGGDDLLLAGGALETYLLEKSRVVRQGTGERNFHAFHMTLDQRPSRQLGDRKLLLDPSKHAHRSMPPYGQKMRAKAGLEHVPEYRACDGALEAIGFDAATKAAAWDLLGGIVSLADVVIKVKVDSASQEDVADVALDGACARAAKLLGWDVSALSSEILCERTVKMRSEEVTVKRTPGEAAGARDAACRWLYGALFEKLVVQCNEALDGGLQAKTTRFVGILDIFGYETLEENGLETLLINYANESLQQLFCDAIFAAELQLYEDEGILTEEDAKALAPPDSTATLQFLAGKGPHRHPKVTRCPVRHGRHHHRKKTGQDERDSRFLGEVARVHKGNHALASTKPKDRRYMFHVQHYAGVAGYTVVDDSKGEAHEGWVVTNLDQVPEGLAKLALTPTVSLVKGLEAVGQRAANENANRRGSMGKPKTVASRFAASMSELTAVLGHRTAVSVDASSRRPRWCRMNLMGPTSRNSSERWV